MPDTMAGLNEGTLPRISADNYLSREFAALEKQHLWPKVWQVACREEEVPNPGDFIVYDVADESIIVVRGKDGVLRSFHNSCSHRGSQIVEGCGKTSQFRCPFHGWTFNLEGACTHVLDRADYRGMLDAEDLGLAAVKTEIWGGFVFINMDSASEALSDYLETIPSFLDPFEYENLRYRWYLELKLPCNWKVALEAFMEGYHVAGTHAQLLPVMGDDHTVSKVAGKHAHFGYWDAKVPMGHPSPRLKQAPPSDVRPNIVEFFRMNEQDLAAILTDRDAEAAKRLLDEVPANADAMTAMVAAIGFGRDAAEAEGAGYPPNLDFAALGRAGSDWHIFPNCVTLPWFDGAIWYRARPDGDDPEKCIFNLWSLKRYAPGAEPKLERRYIDDYKNHSFGLIVDQDLANMVRVQRGMRSRAFRHARPNPVQEMEIINMHRTLENFVLGQMRDPAA